VTVGDRSADNAVWTYERPLPDAEPLGDLLAFYWHHMDAWYEEDEPVFVHARDPRVRVDILPSRRRVTVRLGGEVLADSTRALFLFETGHPVRHYLPREDVRLERLSPSDTRTRCPYKGEAFYWHVNAGGSVHKDLVWSYPEPVRESAPIRDHLCFSADRVDAIEVAPPDGRPPRE
jgi:uncharacterized protein (DUF427 family)